MTTKKRMSEARERVFKGVWIPREIWLSEDLTIMEKLFLVEIDSLDSLHECYASNDHFATFFELTKARCSQIINSLVEKEYITAEYIRTGKRVEKRILRVVKKLNSYQENLTGVVNKFNGGYLENAKEKNTDTKNTIKDTRKQIPPVMNNLEEYIVQYAKEKGLDHRVVDPQHFFDYYERQGWRLKNNRPMKDWKAAVRLWFSMSKNKQGGGQRYKKWGET